MAVDHLNAQFNPALNPVELNTMVVRLRLSLRAAYTTEYTRDNISEMFLVIGL